MSLAALLFTVAVIALITDGYQTLQIALHPGKWQEDGWAHYALGAHPTPTMAVMYFLFCIFWLTALLVLRTGVGPAVPVEFKDGVFVAAAVVEWFTVAKNYRFGIR